MNNQGLKQVLFSLWCALLFHASEYWPSCSDGMDTRASWPSGSRRIQPWQRIQQDQIALPQRSAPVPIIPSSGFWESFAFCSFIFLGMLCRGLSGDRRHRRTVSCRGRESWTGHHACLCYAQYCGDQGLFSSSLLMACHNVSFTPASAQFLLLSGLVW